MRPKLSIVVLLRGGFAELLSDPDLQRRLTERAWGRARADFSIAGARAKFLDILSRAPGRRAQRRRS